ncbi:ABC-three component system middle component 7 [Vibrio metschnikovii]|uniref:ABC-three component system middle component 7 n=1 Tax=Vibrio metschnikovii TaxID=28172 RepID=UPI0027E27E16|nr:ABC-three component system middle component 7 [Vibrio metschnikovii]
MITPSKTISLKDSITFKMLHILDVQFEEISIAELYRNTKGKFIGLDEFIFSLDVLYILGEIDVDLELGKIKKC